VGIGFLCDPIRQIGYASRMQWSGFSGKSGYGQIKSSPKIMYWTAFSYETCPEPGKCLIGQQ